MILIGGCGSHVTDSCCAGARAEVRFGALGAGRPWDLGDVSRSAGNSASGPILSVAGETSVGPWEDFCAPPTLGLMIDLQGESAPDAAKGKGRGHREGTWCGGPVRRSPNTSEMVTANPEMSNIFLHNAQGVEKNRENALRGRKFGGRSLEKRRDSYFSFQ